MQTLLYLYVSGGLVLSLISIPLIAEKIKPNPFCGFRIPKLLKNPDLWYPANKYFAQRLLFVGIVFCLASVGLYFWPGIDLNAYALSCLGVFLGLFITVLLQSWRYIQTL